MKLLLEIPDHCAEDAGLFARHVRENALLNKPVVITVPSLSTVVLSVGLDPCCGCCVDNECECHGRDLGLLTL